MVGTCLLLLLAAPPRGPILGKSWVFQGIEPSGDALHIEIELAFALPMLAGKEVVSTCQRRIEDIEEHLNFMLSVQGLVLHGFAILSFCQLSAFKLFHPVVVDKPWDGENGEKIETHWVREICHLKAPVLNLLVAAQTPQDVRFSILAMPLLLL